MKKILSMILILTLILSVSPLTFANSLHNEVVLTSKVSNLTDDSSSLKTQSMDNNRYSDKTNGLKVRLQGNQLFIQGKIKSINQKFDIEGNAQNTNSQNLVTFDAQERTNHFEVIYLAYSNDIATTSLYHDSMKSKNPHSSVLKVYLREYGSKDLIMLEIFNPTAIDSSSLMGSKNTFSENDESVFWYSKLFKAEGEEMPMLRSGREPNSHQYFYAFHHLGGTTNHYMIVNRLTIIPTSLMASNLFKTQLSIADEWTVSTDFPDQNTNDSCFSIKNISIQVLTDKNDTIDAYMIDGNVNKQWDISIEPKLSINLSIPINQFVGIGLGSISYQGGEQDVQMNENIHETTEITRSVKGELDKDIYMDKEDQHYTLTCRIFKTDTRNDYKYYKVLFKYDVSNKLDYSWGEPRSYEKTCSYYSNN